MNHLNKGLLIPVLAAAFGVLVTDCGKPGIGPAVTPAPAGVFS